MFNPLFRVAFIALTSSFAFAATPVTSTGIPLDAKWKASVYDFAQKNISHPAWGLTHSERNYWLTLEIANRESIKVDKDALFAAAFLHDLGAIAGYEKQGVDHAVRSVELIKPLLESWGFPMAQLPLVNEIVLGHMFYAPAPAGKLALAFRDADILDFLGPLGAARLLSTAREAGPFQTSNLATTFAAIDKFRHDLPAQLSFPFSKSLAKEKDRTLAAFLKAAKAEALDGKAY